MGLGGIVDEQKANFNINKAFTRKGGSPTSITKTLCSQDIKTQESHGRASDISLLSYVFLELYTILIGLTYTAFE